MNNDISEIRIIPKFPERILVIGIFTSGITELLLIENILTRKSIFPNIVALNVRFE